MLHDVRRTEFMLLLLATIAITFATAELPGSSLSSMVEADLTTLRTMRVVSDGYDGIGGTTPESVHAFRRLLDVPNANNLFAELVSEATPPGQLYALCGLYFTDAAAFKTAIRSFEDSQVEVPHQQGCILSTDTVGDIVHSPYRRVMNLEPGDSIKRWFEDHPRSKNGGFQVDIAGGGFCHLIRGTLWPKEAPPSNSYKAPGCQ